MHLIHDLQPYHCTFEDCHDANRIYGTRQEWLEHESLHTRVWHCAAHCEEFETQPEYTAHLHEQHPEQNAEYFSPELIAAAVGPSLRLHRDCPFCPTAYSEANALQKHITFHLERLALLVLPADDEDEIDRSERASDSHEGQRRGRVGSIKGDFTDEEQLRFRDIIGLTASDRVGPKTAMAAIQEAVRWRQEQTFLSQWLQESKGADGDPFQPMDALRAADLETQKTPSPQERSIPANKFPDEAPVEEHFPYLPWRSSAENFNYRPGVSGVRQASPEEETVKEETVKEETVEEETGEEETGEEGKVDQSSISGSRRSPTQLSMRDRASRLISKIGIFRGQKARNTAT